MVESATKTKVALSRTQQDMFIGDIAWCNFCKKGNVVFLVDFETLAPGSPVWIDALWTLAPEFFVVTSADPAKCHSRSQPIAHFSLAVYRHGWVGEPTFPHRSSYFRRGCISTQLGGFLNISTWLGGFPHLSLSIFAFSTCLGGFPHPIARISHFSTRLEIGSDIQHILCARLASFIGLVCVLFIIQNDRDHLQLPLSQYSVLSIITTNFYFERSHTQPWSLRPTSMPTLAPATCI